MDRFVCIHGHFYQPPRENPWLEFVEVQDSAHPYHDWNQRITAECYAPNGASRILDDRGRIDHITNNYARISFNFGPTLLSWLESQEPETYRAILDADRQSQELFAGHGSAIAQAYNHLIMPLADTRDKRTQVIWGIRDFEHRFGRPPEGMWLPETAVDTESLDLMAEYGIRFTILAPHQAGRVRPLGGGDWRKLNGAEVDPYQPYRAKLPSGRTIDLFFYDGPISQAVAFEGLLRNGGTFADRLTGAFQSDRKGPQLVHIATDGETYGHHQRFGDMALAYALHHIEEERQGELTIYSQYLERVPPTQEVTIVEDTSWSCVHGVERWRADCGCNTGSHPGWNQKWRAPLREALDWLRDELRPRYQALAGDLLRDPWAARDAYIAVILDRSPESIDAFLKEQAAHALDESEIVTVLKLLEMQRHLLLMYTSCGWFFDDISGIETVQVIAYAARAIQLARDLFDEDCEPAFLDRLAHAKSNVFSQRDGRHVYETLVRPDMVDLDAVGAHYAISSIFESYPEHASVAAFAVDIDDHAHFEAGRAQLATGRGTIASSITREHATLSFGALHLGDHNVFAGVRPFRDVEAYDRMVEDVGESFRRADFPEVVRRLDRHFEGSTYSLRSLFRDEQRKMLDLVLASVLEDVEASYRHVYDDHAPLIRYLTNLHAPVPGPLLQAAGSILSIDLRRAFEQEEIDVPRIRGLLDEVTVAGAPLEETDLAFAVAQAVTRIALAFAAAPDTFSLLNRFETATGLARSLPFEVDLWSAQNAFYGVRESDLQRYQAASEAGDKQATQWITHFGLLGDLLGVRTDID